MVATHLTFQNHLTFPVKNSLFLTKIYKLADIIAAPGLNSQPSFLFVQISVNKFSFFNVVEITMTNVPSSFQWY